MTHDEVEKSAASARSIAQVIDYISLGNLVERRELESAIGPQPELIDSLLNLSARMTRWKQKDQERSALLESASELIQVRDAKHLLQKLVERARSLIGCDIAYLSEFNPGTGELFVRASRGSISLKLNELRVPPGVGLAGRVVRDQVAHWTSDYDLNDLPHERSVDSAVSAELMRSLLGVPMVVDGEVLGALFAANRYSHQFTSDEINLLTALADHASVILKTARLMGELAEAARTSAAAEELAAAKANSLQRLVEVEELLTQTVLQSKGSAAVESILARTLNAEVVIVDDVRLSAANFPQGCGFLFELEEQKEDILSALRNSRETGRSEQIEGSSNLLLSSVASSRRQYSGLFVRMTNSPEDGDRNIVSLAAQSLALIQMNEQSIAEAENRVRGELAVDVIANTRTLNELQARARTGRYVLEGKWRVIVVEAPSQDRPRIENLLNSIAPQSLMAHRSPGLTMLVPSKSEPSLSDIEERLGASNVLHNCLAIIGDTEVERSELKVVEEELWSCVRILNALSVSSGIHSTEDFAPYTSMFGRAPEHVERFIIRLIGPLRKWDRTHSADLVNTLRAYFDQRGNIRATAQELSVHSNTIKQRLERVEAVLGSDWRSPEFAFRLQVALRLAQVQKNR